MNICLAEIWQAWRASFRKPGFLLLASGVLALGIGASVAVFALIDNTLIRPLPVPQASRLVVLGKIYEGKVSVISPHEYQYLAGMKGVASLGLMQTVPGVNIAGDGMPAQVPLTYVDRTLLPTLGLQPLLGRNFNAQEDQPNGAGAVLLSHGLWQRRFGGNRAVIGGSMQVEGRTVTIIGVLPAAFDAVVGAGAGGIVLPMALPKASRDYNHNGHVAIARLGAGTRIASVAAQTDARERAMYRDMAMGGNWKKPQFGAVSFVSFQHAHSRPMLLVFLASALFVLLIALVNLTNLMLLRALSRNHDAAVRSALGAPLLRLILPALAEGLLVGFGGALLGMLLAVSGLAMLQQFIPAEWMQGGQLQVGASAWLLAFGAGLLGALLAAVLGLWRSRSATAVDELREGGRSGMGTHSGRLGRVLVVTQVALAVTLLCAAGGIAHAIFDAANRPIGFVSDNILTFELAPVKATYPDAVSMQQLSQRLLQRLRAIPGVSGATVTTNLPTSDGPFGQFNNAVQSPEGKQLQVQYHGVGPDFFSLFGIALRDGRGFTRDDVRGGEPVAIVSQNLADTLYDGHAMGKLIQVWSDDNFKHPARIVGVVDDTFQLGPLQPTFPVLYVPLAQMPDSLRAIVRELEPLRFALRGHGNPADWRAGLSAAVAEVAPGQPIASVRSMHSIVRKTTADARLSMLLIGLFATLSLLLAATGMYAVMAVAVAAREREFGVRTALGASPARLVRMVLRGGLSQIVIGLVIGIGMALAVSQLLARWSVALAMSLIGSISAFDPVAVTGVCVLLAWSGLLACLVPAIRAGRVHPMRALRGE